MVTNLNNGRSVMVRINDRGPFVKGRKIDLSRKAARVLGMEHAGTAPVRMDIVSLPDGVHAIGLPLRYYVQVGSFSRPTYAENVRRQLTPYYSDVRVDPVFTGKYRYYRVRMGAFRTRDEAEQRAEDSARFGFPMVIVSE